MRITGFGLLLALCSCASHREASAPAGNAAVGRVQAWDAHVGLEVEDETDFAPTVRRLSGLATSAGGYTESQTASSVILRVPSPRLEHTMEDVAALGSVVDQFLRAQDVTDASSNLVVRIDNLRKLQARLQELAARGQNVEELLQVERELSRVTTELESLEAQKARLDNQVSYASLEVELQERVTPGPIGWVFYGVYRGVKWLFVWD